MNLAEYRAQRAKSGVGRTSVFLRGLRDPIVVFGVPDGRPADRFFAGPVVKTKTSMYPIGYTSTAWRAEAFEIVEGTLTFEMEATPDRLECDGERPLLSHETSRPSTS